MNRRLLDYLPEMEFLDEAESEAPHGQAATMAYSADLLGLADTAQLEGFLAKLVRSIAAANRLSLDAALSKALVASLKGAVLTIMPIHSGANGGVDLKSKAARIFGMELEGLSPEDKEYEVAQQFIRLATDTIHHAAAAANSAAPTAVATAALRQAARQYAPGLLQKESQAAPASGRWRREGRRIILQC